MQIYTNFESNSHLVGGSYGLRVTGWNPFTLCPQCGNLLVQWADTVSVVTHRAFRSIYLGFDFSPLPKHFVVIDVNGLQRWRDFVLKLPNICYNIVRHLIFLFIFAACNQSFIWWYWRLAVLPAFQICRNVFLRQSRLSCCFRQLLSCVHPISRANNLVWRGQSSYTRFYIQAQLLPSQSRHSLSLFISHPFHFFYNHCPFGVIKAVMSWSVTCIQ